MDDEDFEELCIQPDYLSDQLSVILPLFLVADICKYKDGCPSVFPLSNSEPPQSAGSTAGKAKFPVSRELNTRRSVNTCCVARWVLYLNDIYSDVCVQFRTLNP